VYNANHKIFDQKVYEFGRSYVKNSTDEGMELAVTKKYGETQHLTFFMTGAVNGESWREKRKNVDFFDAKVHLVNILHRLRIPTDRLVVVDATEHFLSEGLAWQVRDNKKQLAVAGRIGKELLQKMDCKQEVFYVDIEWDLLLKLFPSKDITFKEIAKFPEVRRDLALVLKNNVTFDQIERVAYASEKKLLRKVSLFDVYQGKGIEDGFKSYALSFILQDPDKTLTDKQIEGVMQKLQKNFEIQLEAKIRS